MALPMQRCWSRLRVAVTLPWPAAGYHVKPLALNLSGVFIPDPEDPKAKKWHKGPQFEAKLYGRYGSLSGVKPEQLWPSPEQLQALEDEEMEWFPSLSEMQDKVEAEERELRMKEQERSVHTHVWDKTCACMSYVHCSHDQGNAQAPVTGLYGGTDLLLWG